MSQLPDSPIPVSPILTNQIETQITAEEKHIDSKRVFLLSLQGIINAIVIGFVARILVAVIDLFTNISFYGKFSFAPATPFHNHLGLFVIAVPVIGSIIVGFMAKYGSAAIRGHGIPEAMEQVLVNESKIKPIITFLKPVSAAISIGTGGPFGAEGPIIATGGALGSFTGQVIRVTANERKIMLAAGACAGMSAIFGTPLAAVLLAIELLLFEFSPRSIIPVAMACATGTAMHFILFNTSPVFAMPGIPEPTSMAMVSYVLMGLVIGVAAAGVSKAVYFIEDLFEELPVHWMWWPAIGGLAVGIIGYFAPRTLGVGYENIGMMLAGHFSLGVILSLCVLKFLSWSISLGSGTSGGTLAPLMTIGSSFGLLLGVYALKLFPGSGINIQTAALIGMAAMFAGASRALLTSIVFALETTMQPHGLLPLLGACTASYFVSFFLMKGSIMTEKIERRGIFTPRSYEPDILQIVPVKDVYNTAPILLSINNTIKQVREHIKTHFATLGQQTSFIVIDEMEAYAGIVNRTDIFSKAFDDDTSIAAIVMPGSPYIYEENQLSIAIGLMDKYQVDILPVISHSKERTVIGQLTHKEIFNAYRKRRSDNNVQKQAISLKRKSREVIVKGKQLFR